VLHIQGDVILHAIIDKEGNISELQVLAGDDLLAQSALAAVRQWRYKPMLFDGEPAEVDTTITITFLAARLTASLVRRPPDIIVCGKLKTVSFRGTCVPRNLSLSWVFEPRGILTSFGMTDKALFPQTGKPATGLAVLRPGQLSWLRLNNKNMSALQFRRGGHMQNIQCASAQLRRPPRAICMALSNMSSGNAYVFRPLLK